MDIISNFFKIIYRLNDFISIFLPFILLIVVLVFVHEMGHYLFAIANGVKVTDFAIGFGPKIKSFTDKKGTVWSLRVIPFGGYVKMLGDENIASFNVKDDNKNLPSGDINSKKAFQKFLIAIGGPLFNFIFSFIVIFIINFSNGITKIEPVVNSVQAKSLAEKLKIQKNDKILSINDLKIKDFRDLKKEFVLNKNIDMKIEREGKIENIKFTLQENEIFGINSNDAIKVNIDFFENLKFTSEKIKDICVVTIRGLKKIITRELSASNLSGPIGIAKQGEDFFKRGVASFFMFLALISVNLGLVNLFPIPVLDGGQALIYLCEGIIRRNLPALLKKLLFYSGYIILIILTLFSFANDIIKSFFS